jgi:hypothetical protein
MRRFIRFFAAFLIISCTSLRVYPQQPAVISWEQDIRAFEHLDSIESYSNQSVLFAGSSSIRLWPALARDMNPFPVIQRGYGGAKLSDMAVYIDRIVYPHPCRAIVLFVGNDITGEEDDISPEETARLFRNLLKTIRKEFPDTPVFWIAVTPTPLRWNVWPEIQQAGERIRAACEKDKNTYFVRTDFAFLNKASLPDESLFMPDRLHLNAEGYAVWSEIIKNALIGVLGE